jgi:hypothetical protein
VGDAAGVLQDCSTGIPVRQACDWQQTAALRAADLFLRLPPLARHLLPGTSCPTADPSD